MTQAVNKTMNKGDGVETLLKDRAQKHDFSSLLLLVPRITMQKRFFFRVVVRLYVTTM